MAILSGNHNIQDSWRYDSIVLNEVFEKMALLGRDKDLLEHDELVSGRNETLAARLVHLWVIFWVTDVP